MRIPNSKVDFGLLGPTIPGTNGAHVRFKTQPVYIVDATGHLSPSSRIVPSPAALSTVIQQLLLGPTAIERSVGDYLGACRRAWCSSRPRSSPGGIGSSTSRRRFVSLPRAKEILAVGQLVLTADRRGGHERHRDQGRRGLLSPCPRRAANLSSS